MDPIRLYEFLIPLKEVEECKTFLSDFTDQIETYANYIEKTAWIFCAISDEVMTVTSLKFNIVNIKVIDSYDSL